MRCGICGKPLKNPTSVRRGVGPVCYRRFQNGELGEKLSRVEELRLKARKQYSRNVRRYPLKEGEVRCKNCGRPVIYDEGDGCPDAYCCFPCCPYADKKTCPREEIYGKPLSNTVRELMVGGVEDEGVNNREAD